MERSHEGSHAGPEVDAAVGADAHQVAAGHEAGARLEVGRDAQRVDAQVPPVALEAGVHGGGAAELRGDGLGVVVDEPISVACTVKGPLRKRPSTTGTTLSLASPEGPSKSWRVTTIAPTRLCSPRLWL